MPEADPTNSGNDELEAWNRKRAEYAIRNGLPFIPVSSDTNAPAVDRELIRQMLDRELPDDEWRRIAEYCWIYPSWIKATLQIELERLGRPDQLLAGPDGPPEF